MHEYMYIIQCNCARSAEDEYYSCHGERSIRQLDKTIIYTRLYTAGNIGTTALQCSNFIEKNTTFLIKGNKQV